MSVGGAIIETSQKKNRTQYEKLLSKCYQNGIDNLTFFWDNGFINKSLVNKSKQSLWGGKKQK
jgi:hypothetical protein